MILRKLLTAVVGCAVAFAPVGLHAQEKRGPSTAEERAQALANIQQWQANPLGPNAKEQFGWVLKWFADVPDMTVHVCTLLDKLPKGDKKDASTVFGAQFMAQAEFVLQNRGTQTDLLAEYLAGVEGALHTYQALVTSNPKDRQPYLDDLVQRRDAGTLSEFVKERAAAACK